MSIIRLQVIVPPLILMVLILSAFSCGSSGGGNSGGNTYIPTDEDLEFINAVPNAQSFSMSIPGTKTLEAESKKYAKVGETAKYYLVTRKSMRDLNNGLSSLLSIIHEVLEFPPSESSSDKRTWQAESPLSGMDAFVPRFRMNRIDARSFYFIYEWRHKDDPAGWRKIWWGEIETEEGANHLGKGEMQIDYDSAAEIDPSMSERGKLEMDFDTRAERTRTITVKLTDFLSEAGDESPANGIFGFAETPDLEGVFSFDIESNWAQESYEYENLSILTSWQSDGVGQSQVIITGEGIDIDNSGLEKVEVRQCWNGSFKETYSVNIYHFEKGSEVDNSGQNPFIQDESGIKDRCPFEFDKR